VLRWAGAHIRTEVHPGDYTVYILTNERRTVLYIGITNELETRLSQHLCEGTAFTRQYNATVLIYYEHYSDPSQAIAREKQLKGWTRAKKVALIRTLNPELRDLACELYPDLVTEVRNDSLVEPRGPSTTRPAEPVAPLRMTAEKVRTPLMTAGEARTPSVAAEGGAAT
jgi:predicted GIY-YIG superfamily endonuclease